jgi:hypothetical protein
MARIFFLLVFIAAAFAGSAGSASAQLLAGTLDCGVDPQIVVKGTLSARCTYWPLPGLPSISKGVARVLPMRGSLSGRMVWGVYSSGVLVPLLQGTFVTAAGGGGRLIGGPGNLIVLHPIADTPGEGVGHNLARFVRQLTLQY